MKKILIISYHSLPMDVIASYRAMAYLKHFKKIGLDPTLLTHHWGDDISCKEMKEEDYDYGKIIRIPIQNTKRSSFLIFIEQLPVINKISILMRWCFGKLDPKAADWDSYHAMKLFCNQHLKKHDYDYILGIFSPHHHLKLCYELHQKFKIPYVLDFRDLWNNRIIHKHYQPNITEKLQDATTKYYWKKWLSKAVFFSITSEPWMNKIKDFSTTKGVIITNGFDAEQFSEPNPQQKSDKFTILHSGSLYSHQKLDIFLEGCQQFIDKEKPKDFEVLFIGGARKGGLPGQISGFLYQPKKYILSRIDNDYCKVTGRISKANVFEEIKKCQLLLFPSLPNSPGTHLGKIFDYIAASKNILMIPDDNSVVGALIKETKTGYIANTPNEVCDYITKCYADWQEKRYLDYHGDEKAIHQYSRESQVGRMADAILKLKI